MEEGVVVNDKELKLLRAQKLALSLENTKLREQVAGLTTRLEASQHSHARLVQLINEGAYAKPCRVCGCFD